MADVFAPEDGEGRRDGGYAPAIVPCAEEGDLTGEFRFQRVGDWSIVPCLEQRGDWLFEPGKIAVVGGCNQRIEGEVFFVLQDADSVEATGRLCAGFHIGRVVLLAQTALAGTGPRPVVAVI